MAVRIEATRGDFTSLGGIHMFDQLLDSLSLKDRLREYLPGSSPKKRRISFEKMRALILGFVAGADCLDDMEVLGQDPGFLAVCRNRVYSPTRYGSFLRSFEKWHPRHLNEVLADTALMMRRAMFKDDPRFVLDIDSTTHQQYSKKMEGLGVAYNHVHGLSSLQAFDQYGFQYWMDVKGGSVHTSDGVSTVVERVFRKVPKRMSRYMRADSGMCIFDVFRACLDHDVGFVITMRANMYEPLIHRVKNWYSTKSTYFKDGRKAEIGTAIYYPKGLDRRRPLRVVFIRAPKVQAELFSEYSSDNSYEGIAKDFNFRTYDFHAWVTSIPESEMKAEAVVDFYKGRGNCENFIRELKNGFDIHHFPCKKLLANKVYGLAAAFAYNLMRMTSRVLDQKIPRFSKMRRFRMVYLAAQVVKKARYTIIRLNETTHREVLRWLSITTQQLESG